MNRNAVFVDTGAWISLLSQGDKYRNQALEVRQQLQALDCSLITSSAVVLEVGDGLSKRNLRHFSAPFRALLLAPKVEVVVIDAAWLDAGWKLFEARSDKQWSLTDCLSFAIMREYELSNAFAHDHHFEQAGFKVLIRTGQN